MCPYLYPPPPVLCHRHLLPVSVQMCQAWAFRQAGPSMPSVPPMYLFLLLPFYTPPFNSVLQFGHGTGRETPAGYYYQEGLSGQATTLYTHAEDRVCFLTCSIPNCRRQLRSDPQVGRQWWQGTPLCYYVLPVPPPTLFCPLTFLPLPAVLPYMDTCSITQGVVDLAERCSTLPSWGCVTTRHPGTGVVMWTGGY